MSTVAEEVVRALRDSGVRHVFGVPSGGWVDYMEALRNCAGIEFVLTSHEGGASFMADVCGRLSGAPGVCFGTFGPGATNLSTGVGGALLDRSPMIALTDEMPEHLRGRTVQMEIDHQALFRPLTKHTTRLRAESARGDILDAAALAMSGQPGPVHVGLPVGMSAEVVDASDAGVRAVESPAPAGDDAFARAAEQLAAARKPVIAVGLTAVRMGLHAQVRNLIEHLDIPVVLTPMAKSILPQSHRCYAGVLFHALSNQVGEVHQQADLVLSIGYDPVEFNYEAWLPAVPLIHADIVGADIDDKTATAVINVQGNLAATIDVLSDLEPGDFDWDHDALAAHRESLFAALSPRTGALGPCATLDALRDVLPEDGVMTCDVGAHTHLIGQKWITPAAGFQIMSNGWSSMGFGIPSAIAAKLCLPDRAVCTVVGDGGFLMTCGEIATAVRERLNIVIVLLTDNDLALIRIKQEKKDNPIYGTPIRAAGAIGGDNIFGAPVLQARDEESLRDHLEAAFRMDGPVIVEAIVDSREYDGLVLKSDRG